MYYGLSIVRWKWRRYCLWVVNENYIENDKQREKIINKIAEEIQEEKQKNTEEEMI